MTRRELFGRGTIALVGALVPVKLAAAPRKPPIVRVCRDGGVPGRIMAEAMRNPNSQLTFEQYFNTAWAVAVRRLDNHDRMALGVPKDRL